LLHADYSRLDFNGFYTTAIDQFKVDSLGAGPGRGQGDEVCIVVI
jgi:hypothetical protein